MTRAPQRPATDARDVSEMMGRVLTELQAIKTAVAEIPILKDEFQQAKARADETVRRVADVMARLETVQSDFAQERRRSEEQRSEIIGTQQRGFAESGTAIRETGHKISKVETKVEAVADRVGSLEGAVGELKSEAADGAKEAVAEVGAKIETEGLKTRKTAARGAAGVLAGVGVGGTALGAAFLAALQAWGPGLWKAVVVIAGLITHSQPHAADGG